MTRHRHENWRPRFRSFRARLMLLVALAVSVPALLTCVILGIQLDRQARTLFATTLNASLETFSLILQDNERNLHEGLKRAATDNTLQITLDLEIKAQLTKYIEAQRQVLHIAFFGVYDRNFQEHRILGRTGHRRRAMEFGGERQVWRQLRRHTSDRSATRQMQRYDVSGVGRAGQPAPGCQSGRRRGTHPNKRAAWLSFRRHAARRPGAYRVATESVHRSSNNLGWRKPRLRKYSCTRPAAAAEHLRGGAGI